MIRTSRLLAAALIVSAIFPLGLGAAEAPSPIVGTWQLTSYSQVFLDTKEVTLPFGENPTGYIQYSPAGHVVVYLSEGAVPRTATAVYSDAERAAVHKGIVGAYAATYRIEGNKVIHHVLTAWRPEWIGTDQVRYFELSGDNLVIKTAPAKFSRTGQDFVGTLTFIRVE